METQQLAALIVHSMGGADNLAKMTYCASRIRMQVRDASLLDRQGLEALEAIRAVLEVETPQYDMEYHLVVGPGNSRSLYQALTALTQK